MLDQGTASDTISQLLENRRRIMAIKHWRAIPECLAEMKETNKEIRRAKGSHAARRRSPATKGQPRTHASTHRIQTGDQVRDLTQEQLGIGRVVAMNWSSKFWQTNLQVQFISRIAWRFETDVEYVAEAV